MKLNYKTPKHLKDAYNKELGLYKVAFANKDFINAWHHLERSHIILSNRAYLFTLVNAKVWFNAKRHKRSIWTNY